MRRRAGENANVAPTRLRVRLTSAVARAVVLGSCLLLGSSPAPATSCNDPPCTPDPSAICPCYLCAYDRDEDGVPDADCCDAIVDTCCGGRSDCCYDNCPDTPNPGQEDADLDAVGDACDGHDDDPDGDRVLEACDNCPAEWNPSQADLDADAEGDRCDLDDGLIYLFAVDADSMHWQPELGFTAWNSYKGDLDVLKASGVYTQAPGSNDLARRDCDLADPWVPDPNPPDAGRCAHFLTTGESGGTESGLGEDGGGAPRPNDNPCP